MPGELQDALKEMELLERERPGSTQQGLKLSGSIMLGNVCINASE